MIKLVQTFIWKLWGYSAVDTSENEKNAIARHIGTWAFDMRSVLRNMELKEYIF